MERKLYAELAARIQARKACQQSNNKEWFDQHSATIKMLVDLLPYDCKIDLDSSHADKLVFYLSYQHMDEGYWDGHTDHTVIVKPSLQFGFTLRITGHDRNDIKDLLHGEFDCALREDVRYNLYLPIFPELAVTSTWEDKEGNPSQCYQAFYSSGARFWNDWNSAKKHAAELMEQKFFSRK